jgi:hypothetical protein
MAVSPVVKRPVSGAKVICLVAGIVMLAIIVFCLLTGWKDEPKSFVWMAPDKLAQSLRVGKLTQLKYRLLRLPGPWRWYTSRKVHILIEMPVMTFSTQAATQASPEGLCLTNGEGMRAWILPPEDLKKWRLQLKGVQGAVVENAMRLTTYDGGQAAISQGNSFPTGTSSVFSGIRADLLPKVRKGSFNLVVGLTSTETISSPPGTISGVQTNFAAACRVMVPNGGGLVVDAGKGKDGAGTNYWFIVSPVAVDAKGNPTKL